MTIILRKTGAVGNRDDQILNLIVREMMARLKLQNIRRNYYDPKQRQRIPEAHIEVWPGYLTSVKMYELRNMLLNVEVIFKFMRDETILEIAQGLIRQNPRDWIDLLKKAVLGTTVLTDYSNKTYLIDDIDITKTPLSEFMTPNGSLSYVRYYQERYNITINDHRQFLLISRARERDIRAGQPANIHLVPELSRATGLTDEMRADYRLMKKISDFTRLTPEARIDALKKFNQRIQETPECVNVLKQWNLTLSRELAQVNAREYEPESIIFGGNETQRVSFRNEWTIKGRTTMFRTVTLIRWIVLYPRELESETNNFIDELKKQGEQMNYKIADPMKRAIDGDRQESYINEMKNIMDKFKENPPRMMLFVLPNNRADRYSALKKYCLVSCGVPCQMVVKNKTMNHRSLHSIATKIAIQLNCKLGGIPWMIEIPIRRLMVIGFDVSIYPQDRKRSMGAICASMDLKESSVFYSNVMQYRDGNEMVSKLDDHISEVRNVKKFKCKIILNNSIRRLTNSLKSTMSSRKKL